MVCGDLGRPFDSSFVIFDAILSFYLVEMMKYSVSAFGSRAASVVRDLGVPDNPNEEWLNSKR